MAIRPIRRRRRGVLRKALDLGYTFFDTAALYGFGANETLLGNALKHRRQRVSCSRASAACSGTRKACARSTPAQKF